MKTTNKTIRQLRNIGIIAHVDAGKTTVSERILYYTGQIHRTVEVHEGGAALDFNSWEQAHGITVSSATTTVRWKDHHLSIIDTPGHIDFNIEVKRALRVLDGAIVVFDAVAGVEPQTETNWRLADSFSVPRIALVNKMDRNGADFTRVCEMMAERFETTILPIHMPVHDDEGTFIGIIDLLKSVKYTWLEGQMLQTDASQTLVAIELRDQIIEALAMLDDEIMRAWDEGEVISPEMLSKAIRKATIAGELVPVLCGTALKNMGVELLLDAVIDYLPAPQDVATSYAAEGTIAYAFKTEAQKHQTLTFCRVYQGSISAGDTLWNTVSGERERVSRIHRVLANEFELIESAEAGEIVALLGLKTTHMGHTLCSEKSDFQLERISVPEAVTAMAVEAKSSEQRDKLAAAMHLIIKEDPTLQLTTDPETGQLIIAGMGELHLQITCEKLEAMSGCEIQLGEPEVSYRETITQAETIDHLLSKQTGGPGMYAGLTILVEPLESGAGIEFESIVTGGSIAQEYVPAVEKGIRKRLLHGLLGAHPVVDLKVTLLDGKMHSNDSSMRAFEIAAYEAVELALERCKSVLLEPIMSTHIECHTDAMGNVIGDINRRRGVISRQDMLENGYTVINADVPLVNLFGAADDFRSLTSGRSTFSMEFGHYQKMA